MRPARRSAAGGAAPGFPEMLIHVDSGRLKRRDETRCQPNRKRKGRGEEEYGLVERNFAVAGQTGCRYIVAQQFQAVMRKQDAHGAARAGEQQAFQRQLPN